MARAIQHNTTCDVYRAGNAPPAAPDVAGVKCFLRPFFPQGYVHGSGMGSGQTEVSHVLDAAIDTDIRDGTAGFGQDAGCDALYVPDKNGTKFDVLGVVLTSYNTDQDRRRVYLRRKAPTWPTSYL